MQPVSIMKDVTLDCSISRFVNNGIESPAAIVFLSHLNYCLGKTNFKLILKTEKVFDGNDTQGFEEGNISCQIISSPWEHAKKVEDGGICLAFLFFSNIMSTKGWIPVPRRGEGYDYICFDSKKEKIVIEVGGRTGKHGARTDLNYKITRFQSRKKITESTYISSVGFEEGEHIVHKYN